MNRFCKILAVLLAMLMLVTMATACKKADGDDLNSLLGGSGTNLNGSGNAGDAGNEGGSDDNGDGGNNPAGDTGDNGNGGNVNTDKPGVNVNQDADKDAQDEIVKNFDATKKYDFASNPLLAASKPINYGVEPSYDVDTTGFVKNNIKVKDLKGKSLTMITALEKSNFIYRGKNGEAYNEWTWFTALKKTYGLNFKYIESRFDKSPQQIITYMNAGKALDIVPTHRSAFPQFLFLSQPLDPYVNLQYVDNSPGIDKRTMEQLRWDDSYRAIAPIGAVDVIWFNETMLDSLGLPNPHKLWEQGKWDWNAFKNLMVSIPQTAPNGNTTLCPFAMSEGDAWTFWARSNGVAVFEIETVNGKSTIKSNFKDEKCLESWVFFADTMKGVDWVKRRVTSVPQHDMYDKGSTAVVNTCYLMVDYSDCNYIAGQKFNWAPWPGKTPDLCYCMNYGNTMMIPKKVKTQSNIPYAVKLMEIWASRFTEAIVDYQQHSYYNFSHEERIQYFDFAAKTNYFNPCSRIFDALTGDDKSYYSHFAASFYNTSYNTATEAKKLYNLVDKAVSQMMEFGA